MPERAGVRGRVVFEADLNRYMDFTREDFIPSDPASVPVLNNAAGEVRLAKNIAAWLAVGNIDPNHDCGCGCDS